jgi:hypothetical protein
LPALAVDPYACAVNDSPAPNAATSKQVKKKGPWTTTFLPALGFTMILGVVLIWLGCRLSPGPSELTLTAIICAMAYLLGIPIGMAASPYKEEGSHFKTIGGLVVSFFSGLVASKLASMDFKATFLGSALQSGRSMLFVSFFVLAVVQTFMFRRYYDVSRARDKYDEPPSKNEPKPAEEHLVHQASSEPLQ